jgi:PhnB protein
MTEPTVDPSPGGTHTVTPHIVVRGAARAAEWYAGALGAEEQSRVPVPGSKLMSVELRFGDSTVMLADEFPEMGVLSPESLGGTQGALHLSTDDVDSLWEQAVEAGAVVFHPLGDTFWGERFGHRWGLAQHVREVPHEDVVRAAAEAFGGKISRPSDARQLELVSSRTTEVGGADLDPRQEDVEAGVEAPVEIVACLLTRERAEDTARGR